MVEDLSSGSCPDCIESLFQKGDDQPFKVTSNDVAQLVVYHVDETALEKILTDTISSSGDMNTLFRQPHLDSKYLISFAHVLFLQPLIIYLLDIPNKLLHLFLLHFSTEGFGTPVAHHV